MLLRWERFNGDGYIAYSGKTPIALVSRFKDDGSCHWKIDGVAMKWIAKGYGDAKSLDGAKAAVARGWRIWLREAGLG
jgi:hypothetical protein